MKKEIYIKPETEVIRFQDANVIVTSEPIPQDEDETPAGPFVVRVYHGG